MPRKAKRDRKSVGQAALVSNATTKFLVKGQISRADNQPLAGLIVRAFDKEMRSEEELGEALPDKDGSYQIQYSAAQLRRPGKKSADLVVHVVSQNGEILVASPI